jgi:hypothetical protein
MEKLAAEKLLQNTERKKEAISRSSPMAVIEGKAADRHETVDMWMEQQVLAPTVRRIV